MIERVARALGEELKRGCVNVRGECYAHVDSQPTMDGMGAEVDGEFSLLGLAEAAIAALPQEDDRELTLGVGDGSGQLFVHGSYDAIKRTQQIIFEREQLSRDVDLLREALTYAAETTNDKHTSQKAFEALGALSSGISEQGEM
jgi:hypothetical protein